MSNYPAGTNGRHPAISGPLPDRTGLTPEQYDDMTDDEQYQHGLYLNLIDPDEHNPDD